MSFGNKPKKIDTLLKEYLKRVPNRKELKRGMVLYFWPEIVGEKIASNSKNLHFENDKLIVNVENSAWQHEIHMNRFSIAKKLNDKVGSKAVKELVVRSG